MNIRTCLLILFVLLFSVGFIGVGSAESGTITVSDDVITSNAVVGNLGSSAFNFSMLKFDSTNFNSITYYDLYVPSLSATRASNYTGFTIISGGTGSGIFSYDNSANTVIYNFSNAIITGSPIILDFDDDAVPAQVSVSSVYNNGGVGLTIPVMITDSTGVKVPSDNDGKLHRSFVSNSESVDYDINYVANGFFTADITKTKDIATKVNVNDSNDVTYCGETTESLTDLSCYENYGSGIYINISLASGAYENRLINSTGTGIVPETEIIIDPTTGAGIIWNETEYYPNDYAELLYEVEQDTWDEKYLSIFGYEYWLKFYRNGEPVEFHKDGGIVTYWVMSGRTGYYPYTVDDRDIGTLTAAMVRCSWVSCSDELATAFTTVNNFGDSWIGIPPKVKAGLWGYFNISFIMGTQLDFNRGNGIKIYYLNPTTDEYELESYVEFSEYSDLPDPIVRNTLYEVIGTTTNQIGQYKFVLYDFLYGELAEAYTESISYKIPSNLNLSVSYIEMPQTAIQYGDWFYVKSGIDTANYTNSSNQFFYSFYNEDISSETSNYAIPSQLFAANYRATSELTSGIDDMFLYDGNNTIRLIRRTNGTDTTLASVAFTVSSIDSDGYGLKLFKPEVCNNEIFTANIISPTPSRFMIIGVSDGIIGQTYYNQTINSTYGTTKEFKISTTGDYLAILTKSDGTELTRIITVTNCAPTVTETPIDTAGRLEGTGFTATGYSWMDNLLYFMSLSAFWGFILFIVVVMVVATNKQASPALGYIAFVVANIEAIIGLWAPFTMYILVLTWVFAGIYFVFGRKIISGL